MSVVRTSLIALGAITIIGAFAWSLMSRRQQSGELGRQLRDVDPMVRARAGVALVDGTSRGGRAARWTARRDRRSSAGVLAAVEAEPDNRVRLAVALTVALTVARHPASARLGGLRDWAVTEMSHHGGAIIAPEVPSVAPGLPLPLLPITSEVLLRDNLLDSLVGTDTDDNDEIDLTLLHRPQPLSWAEGDVDDPEVLPAPQALTPAVHAIRWPPEAPAHSQ